MSGIIRTWGCLNCGTEFDAWENNPPCPSCECLRVTWVPKGGHIAGVSRSGDAEFKALADVFKLDDLHSARRDEAAKKVNLPQADRNSPVMDFGGFVAPVNLNGPACVPAMNKVNFKVGAEVGRTLASGKFGLPSPQVATTYEASTKAKP